MRSAKSPCPTPKNCRERPWVVACSNRVESRLAELKISTRAKCVMNGVHQTMMIELALEESIMARVGVHSPDTA